MKKLYFLNEEESKRILNLHKDATKRQYLKENYDPTKEVLIVGSGNQPSVIFDKKTKRAIRITDNYTEDVAIRLDSTKPTNRSDAETLAKDPIVMCQYNKIIAANGMITAEEIQKCMVSTGKKATDPNPVKQTPCPVGDKKAVMAFQDWLDDNNKGWLPKYHDGLNSEPNKGYGLCGPSTRRAWANVTLKNAYVNGVSPQPEMMAKKEITTVQGATTTPELKLATPNSGTPAADTQVATTVATAGKPGTPVTDTQVAATVATAGKPNEYPSIYGDELNK
jgi:hypothetical protein